MEVININELLPILKNSKLVKTIGESTISIPKKFKFTKFKKRVTYDIIIENNNDLYEVINQLRFYMVEEVPYEVYDYILNCYNKSFPVLSLPDLSNYKDFFYDELSSLCLSDNDKTVEACIKKNNLKFAKYLFSRNFFFSSKSIDIACKYGHIDMIKLLRKNNIECKSTAISSAISGNQFDTVKYCFENDFPLSNSGKREMMSNLAAGIGSLEILKYITGVIIPKSGLIKNQSTCRSASSKGHFECLKYAHQNSYSLHIVQGYNHGSIIRESLQNCNMDCIKYLFEHIPANQIDTLYTNHCAIACEFGNLELLQYLHEERNYRIDYWCIYKACGTGNFECLQYLIENNVDFIHDKDKLKNPLAHFYSCCGYAGMFYQNKTPKDSYMKCLDILLARIDYVFENKDELIQALEKKRNNRNNVEKTLVNGLQKIINKVFDHDFELPHSNV